MKLRLNEILERFREFVTSHEYRNTPILTTYVDIDPINPKNRRERPAWMIELKNELKGLVSNPEYDETRRQAVQEQWARVEDRVMDYLRDPRRDGRSSVLFADRSDFVSVDLPVPVETRMYYGLPQIRHLLFALDQFKKYLVILLSGDELRVVEVFLTRTTSEMHFETGHELARRFGRKSETRARERRDAEYERRFIREVADSINAYFMNDPDFERIVLGGNSKQAHAVNNALHPAVRECVVSIEPIEFRLPNAEIAGHVKTLAQGYELEHDFDVVDDLLMRFNRGGTAVIERQSVQRALERGNVKSLVIPYPVDRDKFDSLIVDATTNGSDIEFVYGEAAHKLKELGGIGATLYYSAA